MSSDTSISEKDPSPAVQTFSMDSDHESTDQAPDVASPPSIDDSDEELRLAKEMAMAIAQNPNLTPAELRALQERKSTNQATEPTTTDSTTAAVIPAATTSTTTNSKDVFSKVNDKAKSLKDTLKKSLSGTNITSSPKEAISVKSEPLPLAAPIVSQVSSDSADAASSEEETAEEVAKKKKKKQNQIRLTGIVWKRRSGLGKYSATAAWERRRIVLKGNRLVYYKNIHHNEEDDSSIESNDPMASTNSGDSAIAAPASGRPSGNWLENMSKQVTDVAANFGVAANANNTSGDDGGAARGYLDLIKENASVAAAFGHSGAPTPFALSVKVLTQTKWKFCFDTQAEQMQWLSVLTDVIVQASVDSYNSSILLANDPKYAGDSHGQLSEPPLRTGKQAETAGGHRLWSTGHYKIKSDNFPDYLDNISDTELQDYEEDMADDENQYREATSDPLALMLDQNSGTPVYCVTEDFVVPFCVLVNMAILLSRASATSVEAFWYILVFTNMAIFVFVQKDRIGMQVQKPVITSKMARRLSSVMGMKILPTVPDEEETDASKKLKMDRRASSERTKLPKKFKPLAGSTAMRIEKPTDPPVNKDGHVFAGWMPGDSSNVQVRSHGYKSTKAKVSSPGELYECAQTDIFEGTQRYPDMASRMTLPKVSYPDDPEIKTWNSPDMFIVSVSLPTDPPKLYAAVDDGGGYTIAMYYTMKQDTRDILKRVTADGYNATTDESTPDDVQKSKVNAVRLFEEWCRRAPTDNAWMARFKCVPLGHNFDEIGLPAWIAKYNGKPFLIKRPGQTGFLHRHPEISCMEFDVSLHPFPYLAKQGICFMKDSYFKKIVVSFGFVIEGRSDDELPECLIGLTTVCYPDPDHALQGVDIFAGTYPKSYEIEDEPKEKGEAE